MDLEKLKIGILNHGIHFDKSLSDIGGNYIWDLREAMLLNDLGFIAAQLLWEKIKKYEPEVLYGAGYGALPLLVNLQTLASFEGRSVKILIARENRKNTNRRRLVEGPRPMAGARAVFVDDMANTGGTFVKTLSKLREEKIRLNTVAVACLLETVSRRGLGGLPRLQARGIPVEYVLHRGDLGISRRDPKKNLIKRTNWRMLTNVNTEPQRLKCPPVIYQNKVVYITDLGEVFCLELSSGQIQWKYQPAVSPDHAPMFVNNDLQIVENKLLYSSYDGTCRMIDLSTGKLIWQILTASYQHSTPSIDIVKRCFYVNAELIAYTENGWRNQRSDISCYDLDTGRLKWRTEPVRGTGPCTVTIVDDSLIVAGSNNKRLRCYNSYDNTLLWSVLFKGDVKGKPAVFSDRIYATSEAGDFKVIDKEGRVLCTQIVGLGARHNFIQVHEPSGTIVLVAGRFVQGFNKDGLRLWMAQSRGVLETKGSMQGNIFVTVDKSGYAMAVDVVTGKKIASSMLDTGPVHAPPYWSGTKLAVHSLRRGLYLYETEDLS